jgi:hypothetical protein
MQSGLIALQRIVNAKLHVDGLQALTAYFCACSLLASVESVSMGSTRNFFPHIDNDCCIS